MKKGEIISKLLNSCYEKVGLNPFLFFEFRSVLFRRWSNKYTKGSLLVALNYDFGFQHFFIDFKDCLECYRKEFGV